MRLRLWHRWFLLSAGLVLLALAAMLWVQEQGFRHGLLDYANALERERLPTLAGVFAEEYRRAGGWQRLQRHPGRWRALLSPEGAPDDRQLTGRRAPPPPPWPPRRGDPRPETRDEPSRPPRGGPRPNDRGDPGQAPRGGPPPPQTPLDLAQRLSLLDADARLVFGPLPTVGLAPQPIEVDGMTVGYLALRPMPALQNTADLDFAQQQRLRALSIALPILLAAVLASLALSRTMLRRLDALARASRRLATGDYAVRLGAMGGDEVGEVARDFDRMAEALQAAQQARDRWIADISHELRTPLTVLRGELQALQDGIRPLDAAALESLDAEAARLAARIEDLYALALSDSGGLRYRFNRLDLAALVADTVAARQAVFARAGLTLRLDAPGPAWVARGDASRLGQLLDNLLGNALRYTDAGGEVRLQVRREAGVVLLQLDDSAPGVPAGELPRLLDRHYRAGNGHRVPGGAGLGLAICRNIVEAHDGQIALSPSPLGGLQVRVTLLAEHGP